VFVVFLYHIGTKVSASGMDLCSVSMDLSVHCIAGPCIRTIVRKECLISPDHLLIYFPLTSLYLSAYFCLCMLMV
jgi:hypothetical protein